jgi:phage recombination protein Bet
MHQAQRTGLDPFSRQIYMIARWDSQARAEKFTIQTGIDGFRVIAERHPQYGGQLGPEWCGADGVWHDVWVSDKPPVAARVGVIRKDWLQPCYATALFREYAGTAKDKQTGQMVLTRMWREKGALMIAKCAEALALRKAFPQDLSGLYTAEEMTQADQHAAAQIPQQRPADPDWASKPATAHERATGQPEPGWTDEEWGSAVQAAAEAGDVLGLQNLWRKAKAERPTDIELREHITQAADEVKARQAAPSSDEPPADEPVDADVVEDGPAEKRQHAHMHILWKKAGVEDRDERLAVTSHLLGHDVASSSKLTYAEAENVIQRLRAFDAAGTDALKSAVDRWLGEYHAARPAPADDTAEEQS